MGRNGLSVVIMCKVVGQRYLGCGGWVDCGLGGGAVVVCSGAVRLMSSNNDSVVRVFDCDNFSVLSRFYFPWAVNVRLPVHRIFCPSSGAWVGLHWVAFHRLHQDVREEGGFLTVGCGWVQHTSVSPDSKTVIVVGDNADGLLADSQSGKVRSWQAIVCVVVG